MHSGNVVKHNGVKAGLKEVSKVASYYVENTKYYYKTFGINAFKDLVKSSITVSASQCIKNFFKWGQIMSNIFKGEIMSTDKQLLVL